MVWPAPDPSWIETVAESVSYFFWRNFVRNCTARDISNNSWLSRSLYLAFKTFGQTKMSKLCVTLSFTAFPDRIVHDHGEDALAVEEDEVGVDADVAELDG